MANTIGATRRYWLGLFAVCYSLVLTGQQVVVNDDRQSPLYGNITLTNLPKSIFEKIEAQSLSDKAFSSFFFVRVGSSKYNVLGGYTLSKGTIVFKPRFMPDASLTHWVHFDPVALSELINEPVAASKISQEVKFAFDKGTTTQIIRFYPDSDTLPANILRAYIYFTQPMSLQNPYQFIMIFDDKATPVDEPFVDVTEGLWNEDRTRLTLFFHPGRIKRGVGPNMTKGNIFERKRPYTLTVSGSWKDARGQAITPFEKTLNFAAPAREKLDINRWDFKTPSPNTKEPLIIRTPTPLDQALAHRLVFIKINNKPVDGQWEVDSGVLKFSPDSPWKIASYTLIVDEALEDICGNTFSAPFDNEIKERPVKEMSNTVVEFEILDK